MPAPLTRLRALVGAAAVKLIRASPTTLFDGSTTDTSTRRKSFPLDEDVDVRVSDYDAGDRHRRVPLPNTSADAGAVTVATSLAGTVSIQN